MIHFPKPGHVRYDWKTAGERILLKLMHKHSHPAEYQNDLNCAQTVTAPEPHDECQQDKKDSSYVIPVLSPESHVEYLLPNIKI